MAPKRRDRKVRLEIATQDTRARHRDNAEQRNRSEKRRTT